MTFLSYDTPEKGQQKLKEKLLSYCFDNFVLDNINLLYRVVPKFIYPTLSLLSRGKTFLDVLCICHINRWNVMQVLVFDSLLTCALQVDLFS